MSVLRTRGFSRLLSTKSVSTPIFYANAQPHVGHLTSAVYADVLNRWNMFKGQESRLYTGTDEHGVKIQKAAEAVKREPQRHVDITAAKFKEAFDRAAIGYERFIRTTDGDHHRAVKAFWKRLEERGYIYKGKHAGWYCVADECFYPESQVHDIATPEGLRKASIESGRSVEWVEEENYMFAMSKLLPEVEAFLAKPGVLFPESRLNDVFAMLKSLQDISISRPKSRQQWGIPVPGDKDHTVYVWIDALVNYLTVTGFPDKWSFDDASKCHEFGYPMTHVIGKDIVRFHAIYWPALLVAAGLPLPEKLIVHAHWTSNRHKMSKSLGNVVDPNSLIEEYGMDAIRYFIIRDGGIHEDADFSEDLLRMRYQVELADKLGNLLNRCFGRALNPKSTIPPFDASIMNQLDHDFIIQMNGVRELVDFWLTKGDIPRAFEPVVNLISESNRYITKREPWKLIKKKTDETSIRLAQNTLYLCLESLRVSGLLLQCVLPQSMYHLLGTLAVPEDERSFNDAAFSPERSTEASRNPVILFPKLQAPQSAVKEIHQ